MTKHVNNLTNLNKTNIITASFDGAYRTRDHNSNIGFQSYASGQTGNQNLIFK